jgi:hypothetical protein
MTPAQPTDYSKTPLIKKLGYKSSFRVRVINVPDDFMDLLGELPDNIQISPNLTHL